MNPNDPAFPTIKLEVTQDLFSGGLNPKIISSQGGFSKRELFAAMAMQGIFSNPSYAIHFDKFDRGNIVKNINYKNIQMAVQYADALIAELSKEKK